jgi:hypothetical protein
LRAFGLTPSPGARGVEEGGRHVEIERLADHILAPEILARSGLSEDDCVGLLEGGRWIACDGGKLEHLEEVRISKGRDRLPDAAVARVGGLMHDCLDRDQARTGHDAGELLFQDALDAAVDEVAEDGRLARLLDRARQLVDLGVAGDPAVIAELVADELRHQDCSGEGYGEAEYADRRIEPVARKVAQRGDEVVCEHESPFGAGVSLATLCRRCRCRQILLENHGVSCEQAAVRLACPDV